MDEEKLKEDDWMKEITSSIGKQVESDPVLEASEKEENQDELSINEEKKKGGKLTKENNKKASSQVEVPSMDDTTVIEKPAIDEVNKENRKEKEVQVEKSGDEMSAIRNEESALNGETLGLEKPDALESYLESAQDTKQRKKWPWQKKLFVCLLTLGFVIGAGSLVCYFMLDQINTERPEDIKKAQTDLTPDELAAQQAALKPQEFNNKIEQKVVNILLVGEEAINDGILGRSDSMMIATLNTVEKSIKLTSLMRDMYVMIPGYKDNKLNAAYHNGGGVLLAETIEQNFGVEIDGYVRVNFDAFEKIVNKLGGVEIELTSDEAHYLNTTNYISKKKYRNVVEGLQTLNGNQALGYCRVRYKTASNGEANDFGRTYRQRTVIKAIFDKYKHQNVVNMISIASELLSYVTTNLSKSEMLTYLSTAAGFGSLELETFRVPLDNSYDGQKVDGKSVLVIDFDTNKQALRDFIYAGIDDSEIKVESGDMEDDRYFSYLWTD